MEDKVKEDLSSHHWPIITATSRGHKVRNDGYLHRQLTWGRIENTDQNNFESFPFQQHAHKQIIDQHNRKNTYNFLEDVMDAAYALPSIYNDRPEQNNPALKKYGEVRPLFNTKEPNFNTPSDKENSINSFW